MEKALVGHQRWVWDCVFSVDGAFLITASSDTTARLWSMANGEEIKIYRGHQKQLCAVLFMMEPNLHTDIILTLVSHQNILERLPVESDMMKLDPKVKFLGRFRAYGCTV